MQTSQAMTVRALASLAGFISLLGTSSSSAGAVAEDSSSSEKQALVSSETRTYNESRPPDERASCFGNATSLLYAFQNDGTWTLAMAPNDDESSAQITLPFTFPLYGDQYTRCWINNNGNLSFDRAYSTFTSTGFPSTDYVMVAPFWADVDTRTQDAGTGRVWYKFLDANNDGTNETLVATWDNVGYFDQHTDLLNTFQVAISNGTNPTMGLGKTACFSYDNMCWTTGDASGGTGGFGGTPATVGCNRGNGTDYFQIGRFNHAGTDYDGPYGNPDGVSWLDGQDICIDTGAAQNLPPVAQGFPPGNMVELSPEVGELLDLTVRFLSPEPGQVTTVTIEDPDGAQVAGLVISNTPGNPAVVRLTWGPDCTDSGVYVLDFTATDNFAPPGITNVLLTIRVGSSNDCNSNGAPDECDIFLGSSEDCIGNGTPDECEPDCNHNGAADTCDLASGTSQDCNSNGRPDDCDVAAGTSHDCQPNGVPDSCEPDCNGNGVADECDLLAGTSQDCNTNAVPDECDLGHGTSRDCNTNGVPDECDIAGGASRDCPGAGPQGGNGIPDECEPDCNSNGAADTCDIAAGTSQDCLGNGIPDECEADCNLNGVADACDIDLGYGADCNANGTLDECDIAGGASVDCQPNGIPDDCEWLAYEKSGLRTLSICQPPDQQAHGGAYVVRTEWNLGETAAESFTFTVDTRVDTVKWWGAYRDLCGEPCSAADEFVVAFYVNAAAPAGRLVASYPLAAVQRTLTGHSIPWEGGFAEYGYVAKLVPPLTLQGGERYWVEVANPVAYPCVWWWETAPPGTSGNAACLHDVAGDGYAASDLRNFDLAFCVSGLSVGQDCNSNGIADAQDIAAGTSGDCQSNGIPDECEADRNFNGIADACDILAGTSKDVNFNGVPDEADCLTMRGDLDGDCDVDLEDYERFAACLGKSGSDLLGGCVCADGDGNSAVEMEDYLAFSVGAGTPDEGCRVQLPNACPDSWETDLSGRDDTFYDFGVHSAIPAGFFGEGSDPFTGVVTFVGMPADPNGVYGAVDTQIQHGPIVFDEDGTAQAALDIITLELASKEPITVTYGGENPEQWLVVAGLSPHYPGPGNLSAALDEPGGNSGTFDATVFVQPAFVFVRVRDLLDQVLPECVTVRVLDTGEPPGAGGPLPPITLSFTDQPFVRLADPDITSQINVPACAQGNFVPGVLETRRRDGSRGQQLTCTSHITVGEGHYFCPNECKEGRGSRVCRYTAKWASTPLLLPVWIPG